jgi:hypothetical protein
MAPTRQMETERSIPRDRVTAETTLGRDGCTLGTMSSKARGRRNGHAPHYSTRCLRDHETPTPPSDVAGGDLTLMPFSVVTTAIMAVERGPNSIFWSLEWR